MWSKAISLALLALAVGGVEAAPVTVEQVKNVARAWARRSVSAGSRIGETVESVSYDETTNGAPFYAVKMYGGGTVFTSGETEIEPIIAFTSAQGDFSKLDRSSPLWAFLNRDLSARHAAVSGTVPLMNVYVAHRLLRLPVNRKAWAEAEDAEADVTPGLSYGLAYAAPIKSGQPSDTRVPAMMRTQWSQGSGVWNYFTPPGNEGSSKNAVCGCVATATAQIMRYLHGAPDEDGEGGLGIPFPVADVERKEFNCLFEGSPVKLTLQGGAYAWDDMPYVAAGMTDEQKRNVGKLTSDIGISVGMQYSLEASGASYVEAARRLVDLFGYRQYAWCSAFPGSLDVSSERGVDFLGQTLFANFDVRRPCMVGIPGHAIVADGYGYEGEVPYVHLNFGWAGQCDFWYNLPDMTAAGDEYTLVDEIGYNLFPEVGGIDGDKTTHAVLAGRVLDEDGFPAPDYEVVIRKDGEVVTNVTTDAKGIWAAILPEGTYTADTVSEDAVWMAASEDIPLDAAACSASPLATGNSWGNDLVLQHPSVCVGERIFSSLDRAIAYGRQLSATSEVPVRVSIEIIDGTFLKRSQEIDFDCVIVATNADPYATSVDRGVFRKTLATLTVANGVTVAFSNIVFTAADASAATNAVGPVLSVRAGGTAALAGIVDFGVPYEETAVFAEAKNGLALLGPISCGFNLACPAAPDVGDRFATVLCDDFEAISNCAVRIANACDPYGEIRGQAVKDEGTGEAYLVWTDAAQVPLADAAGYYVDAESATNTRARVDRLFEKFAVACTNGTLDAKELVVLRSGALARPLTVGDDVTIRGEGADLEIDCAAADGFTVTNGLLTVDGLAFTGYRGNALFLVNGGDLVLTNAVIDGAVGTNKWSGAVAIVRAGSTASLLAETVIRNCEASGQYSLIWPALTTYGGGVYVGCGATNVLDGCAITACTATYGGGVYVENGTKTVAGGTVRLAGASVVTGNVSGDAKLVDDVHVHGKNSTQFIVESSLVGTGTVGVKYYGTRGGNGTNDVFAALAESQPDGTRFEALFNDTDPALEAVAANGTELVWAVRSTWKGKDEPFDGALVKVENPVDGTVYYYAQVEDAFDEITGDSDVTLLSSDLAAVPFGRDLEVKHAVKLTAEGSPSDLTPYGLCRTGDCSIRVVSGGSLTIADCYVYGCELEKDAADVYIYDAWRTVPLLLVDGGELTLEAGAGVGDAFGMGRRSANAVTVWNGGAFTMKSGSEIFDSENAHDEPGPEFGCGGGLLVDGSTARLEGGAIWYCNAVSGGGVFIGNESTVHVSGELYVGDNINCAAYDTGCVRYWNDMVVSEDSALVLDGPFDGSVGYTEGINRSREVFGEVGPGADLAQAAADATNFWHNVTHARGVLATSVSGKSILVWADAFRQSEPPFVYTDESGEVFTAAAVALPAAAEEIENPQPPITNDIPTAVTGLVYDGTEKTGVLPGEGYVLFGNTATNAGEYVATAVLKDSGYVWPGGYRGEIQIPWVIMAADLDPIAFSEITRISDAEWKLVVTNLKANCSYRLLWTEDLTKGFTATGGWATASALTPGDGVWTTNIVFEAPVPEAVFWKAEGATAAE